MRVIVDAFGGDHAPLEVIKGCAEAVKEYGHTVILSGNEETIRRVAEENHISLEGMEILDCDDVIGMHDAPRSIMREHKNCSMAVGMRALVEGKGDAFVSAGSTGALLMGGTFIVKRIKGISRPALAAILPTDKGPAMLLDSGANVDCRASMLMDFARMGSIYMTDVMKNGEPARVGLLNVGTEDTKGGDLQHETFALLKDSDLNFIGNIEARQVPFGEADVIVADGFGGNVLIKSMEGIADMILGNLKTIFKKNPFTILGYLLISGPMKSFKKKMSTSEYGGAPLLGVQKPVLKAHGNAKAKAIKNAVRVVAEFAAAGVVDRIAQAVKSEEAEEDT